MAIGNLSHAAYVGYGKSNLAHYQYEKVHAQSTNYQL